jgi:hypothetical protein
MENYDLVVSAGDSFVTAFQFNLNGYTLTGNERITFNIKEHIDDVSPVISTLCGIDKVNNVITAYVSADEMKNLLAGNYFYDVDDGIIPNYQLLQDYYYDYDYISNIIDSMA